MPRIKTLSRLALVAVLGAAAFGAQAQTATNPRCTELRNKLDANLAAIKETRTNLARLKSIIRVYNDQKVSSLLPSSGIVVTLDDAEEKARLHEARIEDLTLLAGVTRAEIKRCESAPSGTSL